MKNLKLKTLSLLGMVLLLLLSMQLVALGKTKETQSNTITNINLQGYQQSSSILKILSTTGDEVPFQLGIANIQMRINPQQVAYYQGVWIMDNSATKMRYPLVLQRFIVSKDNVQGIIVNKHGQTPYLQALAPVQTAYLEPIATGNADTPNLVRLPKLEKINTPAGEFETLVIKTYNPLTQEGLLQYLAKDLGVIRLESFTKDQHYIIAELTSYRPLTEEETKMITGYLSPRE